MPNVDVGPSRLCFHGSRRPLTQVERIASILIVPHPGCRVGPGSKRSVLNNKNLMHGNRQTSEGLAECGPCKHGREGDSIIRKQSPEPMSGTIIIAPQKGLDSCELGIRRASGPGGRRTRATARPCGHATVEHQRPRSPVSRRQRMVERRPAGLSRWRTTNTRSPGRRWSDVCLLRRLPGSHPGPARDAGRPTGPEST